MGWLDRQQKWNLKSYIIITIAMFFESTQSGVFLAEFHCQIKKHIGAPEQVCQKNVSGFPEKFVISQLTPDAQSLCAMNSTQNLMEIRLNNHILLSSYEKPVKTITKNYAGPHSCRDWLIDVYICNNYFHNTNSFLDPLVLPRLWICAQWRCIPQHSGIIPLPYIEGSSL